MSNKKIFGLFLGIFLSFSVYSQSQVEQVCGPILNKVCATNDCSEVDSKEGLKGLFERCKSSVIDLDNLKSEIQFSQVSSDIGYLVSYSNLISRALVGNNYSAIKKDYEQLSFAYDKHTFNNKKFLQSLSTLTPSETNKRLLKRIEEENSANRIKIKERSNRLDFMLKSEDAWSDYKLAHKKLIPAIIFEVNTEKFKNKTLSAYECRFLEYNFDKEELKELHTRLHYQCSV